jgi:hypothetical protein
MKKLTTATGLALAAGLVGGLSACGTTAAKVASAATPASSASSSASAKAPAAQASSSPSSGPLSGPVGTTYQIAGANGPNGQNTVYTVTLVQVEQQATLTQYGSLTNGSDHVTAAEFSIKGKTGESSDDANSDAVAVGSDSQDYTSSSDDITAGTNFNSGEFDVTPGQAVTGWVSFELAPGATMASIQWSPGFGSQTATWTLG